MQGLLSHLLKKKILRLYFSAPSKKTKVKYFSFKWHWLLYVIVCSDIFAIWIDLHIAGHYNDAEEMNIIFKLWIFICGLKVAFFKMISERKSITSQIFFFFPIDESYYLLTSHVIYNWGYTSNASYTCRQLLNTGLSVTSLGEVKMPFPWCTDTQEEGLC